MLEDIADYEYLLVLDQENDEHALHERDREIALQWSSETGKNQTLEEAQKASLLSFWLEQRRSDLARTGTSLLPGASVTSSLTLLKILLACFGLVSGFSLVTNVLQYEGQYPTNVSYYFLCVILIQIFLLVLFFSLSLLRKLRGVESLQQNLSFIATALQSLALWIGQKVYVSGLSAFPEKTRQQCLTRLHELLTRSRLYRQSIRWQLGATLQWFGLTFNIGAVLTLLALVVFSDRAFGWQTSLEFASEMRVYQICRILALPWSWLFGEGVGFLSLQHVAESRIVLHQPLIHRSAEALHAWWPFLMLANVTYGLLPRFLLLLWSRGKSKRAFRALDFTDYESDKLWRRLTTPIFVETPVTVPKESHVTPTSGKITLRPYSSPPPPTQGEALLLVSVDLEMELEKSALREIVATRFGREVHACFTFGRSYMNDQKIVQAIRQRTVASLFLVDQDWNAPIPEDLERIQQFYLASGHESQLIILLTGTPSQGRPTQTEVENLQVWKQQIATLHQPHIGIETLIG